MFEYFEPFLHQLLLGAQSPRSNHAQLLNSNYVSNSLGYPSFPLESLQTYKLGDEKGGQGEGDYKEETE